MYHIMVKVWCILYVIIIIIKLLWCKILSVETFLSTFIHLLWPMHRGSIVLNLVLCRFAVCTEWLTCWKQTFVISLSWALCNCVKAQMWLFDCFGGNVLDRTGNFPRFESESHHSESDKKSTVHAVVCRESQRCWTTPCAISCWNPCWQASHSVSTTKQKLCVLPWWSCFWRSKAFEPLRFVQGFCPSPVL